MKPKKGEFAFLHFFLLLSGRKSRHNEKMATLLPLNFTD